MQLFYAPDIKMSPELPEEEALHCLRVLRLGAGSRVRLTDGRGFFYDAVLSSVAGKRCAVSVEKVSPWEKTWRGHLHMAVAPTKNMDRMEWFVEKAVEIGVDELTFLNCRYSERRMVKLERVEKIMVSAMKQSLKAVLPKLNGMLPFDEFVRKEHGGQRFIAHCHEGRKEPLKSLLHAGENATILIGPEGDFSAEEVEAALALGFSSVSLGASRLRTETAALAACHTFSLLNGL